MKSTIARGMAALALAGTAYGSAPDLLQGYESAGAGPFSASEGSAAWVQEHRFSVDGDTRSCATCHGTDISLPGRHATTGKRIEPMALSVNPGRLNDPDKVEKWFRRNCRWTLGRECTAQEKGDFVRFMASR